MKLIILASLLLTAPSLFAVKFKLIGACSPSPLYIDDISNHHEKNLGKLTIQFLEQNNIKYIGNSFALNSINNSPTDLDNIEIVSDMEMRVHGWCYIKDGQYSNKMMGEVSVEQDHSEVVWFYGYATYYKDSWVDYCVPTWTVTPTQFCED